MAAQSTTTAEALVKDGQNRTGGLAGFGYAAQNSDGQRGVHRGGQPFAGDVANLEADAVSGS
jgi:hypothetical protein